VAERTVSACELGQWHTVIISDEWVTSCYSCRWLFAGSCHLSVTATCMCCDRVTLTPCQSLTAYSGVSQHTKSCDWCVFEYM